MGIEIASSFTRKAAVPLDDSTIVADTTARDAIASGIRYEGMEVYVTSLNRKYRLVGGIADINWTEVGSGSSASVETGITAHAGGGQASAYVLTNYINQISVVATDGDSVKLNPATAGAEVIIINDDTGQYANVFPATGETIDFAAANTAYKLKKKTNVRLICAVAGAWKTAAGGGASIEGDSATTQTLANAAAITLAQVSIEVVKVKSNGGEATVTIPDGTIDNQIVYVRGTDSANPVIIANTGNVVSNGDKYVYSGMMFTYMWDTTTTKWYQVGGW